MKHESFPVVFENDRIQIYRNPSNEIFVENKGSGVKIRISADKDVLQFTTHDRIEPTIVANMIGWRISSRYKTSD